MHKEIKKYDQDIAGKAFDNRQYWERVDALVGPRIEGWILLRWEEGIWTWWGEYADARVRQDLNNLSSIATEIKEAKALKEKIEKESKEGRTAEHLLRVANQSSKIIRQTKKLKAESTGFREFLMVEEVVNKAGLIERLQNETIISWAEMYRDSKDVPRLLFSEKNDSFWVLLYLGQPLPEQYFVTWKNNAFRASPLTERTLLSVGALIAHLLSSNLKASEKSNSIPVGHGDELLESIKKIFEVLKECVQSSKLWSKNVSRDALNHSLDLRPIRKESLGFFKEILHDTTGYEGAVTSELIAEKLKGKEAEIEKQAKQWEVIHIFELWRILPKVPNPDAIRQALARVLADKITQTGMDKESVAEFLASYQMLMDQNGMDKTAPHPLYYMLLSRKSRGALLTLVDACEDETLTSCAAWSVDKGTYEPRVWQALLDGLTDRLTLKFRRSLYDADAFSQIQRIIENSMEMIESKTYSEESKLPASLQEAYRWRLVSLMREALCHADTAIAGGTETGGADEFKKWLMGDFMPRLTFVEQNQQMKSMFTMTDEG